MKNFVGDNSFYSCYLNDVKRPEILLRYLDYFKHHIGPIIKKEMSMSPNYVKIKTHNNLNYFPETGLEIQSIVAPLFSSQEKHKGEQEVLSIAYMAYCLRQELIIVVDERATREIIKKNISILEPFMTGTIGLLIDSVEHYKLLSKTEVVNLLSEIENSNFRVDPEIISKAKKKLTGG